jgi:hypothetical protein
MTIDRQVELNTAAIRLLATIVNDLKDHWQHKDRMTALHRIIAAFDADETDTAKADTAARAADLLMAGLRAVSPGVTFRDVCANCVQLRTHWLLLEQSLSRMMTDASTASACASDVDFPAGVLAGEVASLNKVREFMRLAGLDCEAK